MAKIKLAKSAIQAQAVELPDMLVPGLLRKITPEGREMCTPKTQSS